MKRIIFSALVLLVSKQAAAQQHVYLHFTPKVGGEVLLPNTNVQDLQGVDMSIEYFNYYISNLHLIDDQSQNIDLSDSVFLVKMTDYVLDLGMLDLTTVTQVNFGVGVPYELSHLDISQYPERHSLGYQTPSMHWGWTAGYAHMIVDGFGDSNGDNIPDAAFQLHNLGDMNYKQVELPVITTQTTSDQLDIYVNCNLDQWIYGQNPGTVLFVHGSGAINTAVMTNVDDRNVFDISAEAGVTEITTATGFLKAYISNNLVQVSWSELKGASCFTLIDMNGKMIEKGTMSDVNGTLSFPELISGSYVFTAYSENLDQLNQLRIVK